MKKVRIFAAAFALIGMASLNANAQTEGQEQQTTQQQTQEENKEKIEQAQLPAPVQETLKGEAFAAWNVSEVYKVAADAQTEGAKTQYEIIFTNEEDQKAKIRIDEEGQIIREEE